MKKKIIGITSILFVVGMICIINYYQSYQNNIYDNKNIIEDKEQSSGIAIMVDNDESGNYVKYEGDTWPGTGYIFDHGTCINGGKVTYDSVSKKVITELDSSDMCTVYFKKHIPLLTEFVINTYNEQANLNNPTINMKEFGAIYLHDGSHIKNNVILDANDNSYRYAGKNPNNFVCFGSDEIPCPDDNKYRIIGVFFDENKVNQNVKLIKSNALPAMEWDKSNSTDWNRPSSINSYMNTTFLDTFKTNNKWITMLNNHYWQVGRIKGNTIREQIPAKLHDYEIKNPVENISSRNIFGLMYASDYAFAVSHNSWENTLYQYDKINDENWLNIGISEWLIAHGLVPADMPPNAYYIHSTGYAGKGFYLTQLLPFRPVFYLNSTVKMAGGKGTNNEPFILK